MKKTLSITLLLSLAVFLYAQAPRLAVPIGNVQSVSSVAFSPDGKYVLTGGGEMLIGSNGVAKLWDMQGREILSYEGHESQVTSVAFSPDSKMVLTGSSDQTAKLWDLQGREILTFKGHSSWVYSVAFSPDGKQVLTGSGDKTAKLWDLKGQVIYTFKGHTEQVTSALFSPDGRRILTSGEETAILWDLKGSRLKEFKGNASMIISIAFSSDGQKILVGYWDGTVKLWDAQGAELGSFVAPTTSMQSSVALSPDDQLVLTGARDGSVALWDLQGNAIQSFKHNDWITSVVFSSDGRQILTGCKDNIARLWDLKGREIQTFQGHSAAVNTACFSPDGQRLLMGSADAAAKLWDVQGRTVTSFQGHSSDVKSAAFSPDGQRVLSYSEDYTAKLWDLQGRVLQTFHGPGFGINSAAFLPDGQRIIAGSDKSATLWDVQGREIQSFAGRMNFSKLVCSPDGQYLLTEGDSYNVLLLDMQGREITSFDGHTGPVWAMAFSPDGQRVLTGSGDNTAKLWDLQGREIQTFKGHIFTVDAVAFSSDGRHAITGSWDNTAKLWDMQGRELHTFKHTKWVRSVCFSPDGQYALTGSSDHTSKLWDTKTGKELATLLSVNATDWVVTTPSGLFDASPGAMNFLYFVSGLEVIELDQLKERYFEPGLLSKILGLNRETARSVEAFNAVALYPEMTARLSDDKLNLQVSLTPRNGGIGKLSLFVNGKEVTEDANPQRVSAVSIDLTEFAQYYLPNEPNKLALRVYNEAGWLKSSALEIEYQPPATARGGGTGGTTSFSLNKKPSLYAVVVGTANYAGDKLDLKFADLDAAYFSSALRAAAPNVFGERVYVTLLSTDAEEKSRQDVSSKTTIKKAFADVAAKAQAQDILVIYFSGHGVNYGAAESGQFYYLTKDIASENLTDPEIRNNYAISSSELTEWIKAIPALKQVMIIDACNSGKIVEDLAAGSKDLNSSQVRALDRMKDRTGMFILTGSAADKVSYEAGQYGQGLLTYSLLQGMSGLALTEDKRVDVMTLFQYSRDKVPDLAKGIGGVQTPVLAFPLNGASFDIGIVDASVKIPVAQIKPVFIRNNFQDEATFDDGLGLTQALADYFRRLTVKGAQAELIYVDVSEYENAYSIKGRYTVQGDAVTVRARLFKGKTAVGAEFTLTGKKSGVQPLVEEMVGKVSGMVK